MHQGFGFSIVEKYTKHITYHASQFKVCDPVALSMFAVLCNHHHYRLQSIFTIIPNGAPIPIKQSFSISPFPPESRASTNLLPVSMDWPIPDILYKGDHAASNLLCPASLLSMFWRFVHL